MFYVLDTEFELGMIVRRKLNEDETFIVIGYDIHYADLRGDITGYEIVVTDIEGNPMLCKPYELELITNPTNNYENGYFDDER
jgi:hypothetical protein